MNYPKYFDGVFGIRKWQKNTFYSVKQTQGEQDPPNFDGVFTERLLLPREVKKMCGIRHFRKTGMGRLRHLRCLRRFSPT